MTERWTPTVGDVVAVRGEVGIDLLTGDATVRTGGADNGSGDILHTVQSAPWRTAAEIEALDALVEAANRIGYQECEEPDDSMGGVNDLACGSCDGCRYNRALAAVQKAREGSKP